MYNITTVGICLVIHFM